jgi:prepilin-type N-terminal cleavage/methylation domain-containing protein
LRNLAQGCKAKRCYPGMQIWQQHVKVLKLVMLKGIYNFLKRIFHKSLGFTIIELLFVIAIIGVLFTLTISTYRSHTLEFKIKTTAEQMQQILQAGSNYYYDHNDTYPTDGDADFITKYIMNQSKTDPFGGIYSWCTKDYKFSDKIILQKFNVCLHNVDIHILHRAGALLANSRMTNLCTGNDNSGICTELPPALPTTSMPIASRGVGSSGDTVLQLMGTDTPSTNSCSTSSDKNSRTCSISETAPTCPAGTTPKIVARFVEIGSLFESGGHCDPDCGGSCTGKCWIKTGDNVFSNIELFDDYNTDSKISSGCSSGICKVVIKQKATSSNQPPEWIAEADQKIKYAIYCR